MNEPSVFSGAEGTLYKNLVHVAKNKTRVFHRDVHNTYGLLMTRATY